MADDFKERMDRARAFMRKASELGDEVRARAFRIEKYLFPKTDVEELHKVTEAGLTLNAVVSVLYSRLLTNVLGGSDSYGHAESIYPEISKMSEKQLADLSIRAIKVFSDMGANRVEIRDLKTAVRAVFHKHETSKYAKFL